MKTFVARREFLRQATRGFGMFALSSTLVDGLMLRILNSAFAQSAAPSADGMFYVHLTMAGAPPRWYFDLPLRPTGSEGFVPGGFGTTVANGATPQVSYTTQKFTLGGKSLHLPPVWGMNLSQQNFAQSVLPHTMFIRGVDMEINNHLLSNQRQVSPVIGGYSLSGMVADRAGRPIPGLVDTTGPAGRAFRSKKGLSGNEISYNSNPVSTLLAPFAEYRKNRVAHGETSTRLGEQALAQFEQYAKQNGLTESALTLMYDSALELVEKNVSALSDKWAQTHAKYRGLVIEAVRPTKGTLPGVFDNKITATSARHPTLRYGLDTFVSLSDLRDVITENTDIQRMAENFALAEILLGDITATTTMNMTPLINLRHGTGNFNATHDQHDMGSAVSVIITTLFYRALLGCVSAFVENLKQKNIFDKTVIQISSEFNRTPRADGSGSDHGFMGSAVTLISGKFQSPTVIGNIQKADYTGTYKGTFGVAAPFPVPGEAARPLRINDVARTVSALLGVDDVTTNGVSLVAPEGNLWIPRANEAKNV